MYYRVLIIWASYELQSIYDNSLDVNMLISLKYTITYLLYLRYTCRQHIQMIHATSLILIIYISESELCMPLN